MATTDILLGRYAEASLWMARYMERAESLARILDILEWFGRDGEAARNWRSVVQIYADETRFDAQHPRVTAQAVKAFYFLDLENPTSVRSAVRSARENARVLRPMSSTEMWVHINVLYNRLMEIKATDIQGTSFSETCAVVRESCQAHAGIIEGTFFRDQAWYFNQLGRYLERADQTTRLLDIKYHLLAVRGEGERGQLADASQWQALLRSAASYNAFRRVSPGRTSPEGVVAFLLTNLSAPRSVAFCVSRAEHWLTQLRMRFGLSGGAAALEALDEVRAALAAHSVPWILEQGLHEYLDWVQRRLITVQADLVTDFFSAS